MTKLAPLNSNERKEKPFKLTISCVPARPRSIYSVVLHGAGICLCGLLQLASDEVIPRRLCRHSCRRKKGRRAFFSEFRVNDGSSVRAPKPGLSSSRKSATHDATVPRVARYHLRLRDCLAGRR